MRNKFFKGLLFFEIVLLYTKNQRTMAPDFQKYCFFQKLRFAVILKEFSSYFSSFIHTSWHGKISCSEMTVCCGSLTNTGYSKFCPIYCGLSGVPAQAYCCWDPPPSLSTSPGKYPPAWGQTSARDVTRWICFVRNWYSKEAPANSMIFKISFENQASPARDSFETNFKRTKLHLALSRNKISDHHDV
jgi:hypothetical protein